VRGRIGCYQRLAGRTRSQMGRSQLLAHFPRGGPNVELSALGGRSTVASSYWQTREAADRLYLYCLGKRCFVSGYPPKSSMLFRRIRSTRLAVAISAGSADSARSRPWAW